MFVCDSFCSFRFSLGRKLQDEEVEQLIQLLNMLEGVFVPRKGAVFCVWDPHWDGLFTEESFYDPLSAASCLGILLDSSVG